MTASELFHAARLREAIDDQTQKVRANPTDQAARFFLFEMFLFAGDLDRAGKQLDVLRYDDPRHTAAVQQYRGAALAAEAGRRAVFAGTGQPKVLGAAPDHVRTRLEALGLLARGETAEARRKLTEANAAVPKISGTLDGKPFDSLYDADERFGTVIEVFGTGGVYTWLPLEEVRSIRMNPPQTPRDVFLRPADITMTDGVRGDVLIPGLYPDSHAHPDDEIKLGRGTEWLGADGEVTRGAGGRLFMAGGEFVALNAAGFILLGNPR